jgi:putative ABC transport system permease protein
MRILRFFESLLFLFYQSVVLALSQIWANKMRSVLTTIGIVIGVASVSAVIAALTGLKGYVLSNFESLGTNKLFIFPDRPDYGPLRNAPFYMIRFRPELFSGMEQFCPSLKNFSRTTQSSLLARYGEKRVEDVDVSGIEASWHEIERRGVELGRPFSLLDNELARPVCLINATLRDKLGLPTDPTGQRIMLGQRRFLVIGVVETKQESAMFRNGFSGAQVFVPFPTLWQMSRTTWGFPFMMVVGTSKSTDLSAEAKAEITFFLRKKRNLKPSDPNTFRVEFVDQFVQQFNSMAAVVTGVAIGIVGISLLVGGVGIMNIMLVSVSERTREIGLRKAVGARPTAILLQFLVEAVVLCCTGGLIGLIIGQGITIGLRKIPGADVLQGAVIPWWAIVLAFVFSTSVGLIFGMFPAIKAARLDPIDALRHE